MMARIVNDVVGIGLRTRNPADRIALRGVRLRSRLTALCERTTIEQTFVNAEPRAIEAVYTFPLPDGAAVCGFEVITGDRCLTGVVEESNRAIEKYEDAVSSGDGAFLMEQERTDVFTVRVGNLKARQAATIRISYVRALTRSDRTIRVAFPTTVAPRYVTDSGGRDPIETAIDGDALNPPHVLHVPYGLSMEVEIDLGRGVREVTSPSHAVRVEDPEDDIRRVTFAGGITEMNHDVVLSLEMAKEERPSVRVGRWTDGKPFVAVTFMPEFDVDELAHPPAPSEVVFVLDCSGSMQGESIEQAEAALELCLRSLSKGDTFNICRFGSTFDLMAPESVPYNADTLRRAIRYVNRGADLGGTELLAPLEAILRVPTRTGTARQIILLTDGQISNEAEVIALARAYDDRCRVFAFAIGAAASASLVNGLARVTHGAAEFIANGERIEDKVLRTFGRLASPQVSDVELDFGGADVQTLASIPPIFDGDSLAVYGRVLGRLPAEVTLRCKSPTGPKSWIIPVPEARDDGGAVALMFARRAIQSFEDVNSIRRPVHRNGEAPTRDESRLIGLSKEFGLLCSLTTFVAIEHRTPAERNDGRPALRRVPVMLAEGWGGVEIAGLAPLPAAPAQAPKYAARHRIVKTIDKTMDRTIDRLRDSLDRSLDCSRSGFYDRDRDIDMLGEVSRDPAEAPIRKLFAAMIREALNGAATEVHIEPLSDRGRVRYRINDTLEERDRLPLRVMEPLMRYIKRMGHLAMDVKRIPQSGTAEVNVDGRRMKLTLDLVPSQHGQSMVIHLPPAANKGNGLISHVKNLFGRHVNRQSDDADRASIAALRAVLLRQAAEGSFTWDGGIETLLPPGIDVAALRNTMGIEVEAMGTAHPAPPAVIDTALVLLTFRTAFGAHAALWERAAIKAMRFIADAIHGHVYEIRPWLDRCQRKLTETTPASAPTT